LNRTPPSNTSNTPNTPKSPTTPTSPTKPTNSQIPTTNTTTTTSSKKTTLQTNYPAVDDGGPSIPAGTLTKEEATSRLASKPNWKEEKVIYFFIFIFIFFIYPILKFEN